MTIGRVCDWHSDRIKNDRIKYAGSGTVWHRHERQGLSKKKERHQSPFSTRGTKATSRRRHSRLFPLVCLVSLMITTLSVCLSDALKQLPSRPRRIGLAQFNDTLCNYSREKDGRVIPRRVVPIPGESWPRDEPHPGPLLTRWVVVLAAIASCRSLPFENNPVSVIPGSCIERAADKMRA